MISLLTLIDFTPHMSLIFLHLCMPDNFLLDARHCEFYLACWIFLFCINILELCSGMQLNYLEIA